MSSKSKKSLKDLPLEVLEIVFAFLPQHVICRFRVICKAWNHLILQPGFASLRTFTPRQAFYILMSPKLIMLRANTPENTNWHVLDVGENRCYKLPRIWMLEQYKYKWKYTLATDRGLIYTMYLDDNWFGSSRRALHIVYNLVSKSFHEIPELEFNCSTYNNNIVIMSVDNVTNAYKIITITGPRFVSDRGQVYLYDSTTSIWRNLCEVPVWGMGYHASSIFVNGILYTLFAIYSRNRHRDWWLYSCDLATGAWSKINVDLPAPSSPYNKLQLVVSLNQLFMVEYSGIDGTSWKQWITLSIWKIVLAKGEVVKVANMQKFCEYFQSMFPSIRGKEDEVMGNAVVTVGCANAIVISSLIGRRVKFDLLERCWYELPPYTLYNQYGSLCEGICTGLVDI